MLKNWQQQLISVSSLVLLGALIVFIRSQFLDFPFERDEGLYAYFASLILDGKLPYEAFYDPKPPGLFYTYAAIMALFGESATGLHIGFIVVNLLTTLFIFLTAKKIGNWLAGLVSAFAFAMLSLTPAAGGLSVLSEHLVVLWVALGLYLLLIALERKSLPLLTLSGLAFGLSLLVKQNGIFFIAAAGFYLAYYYRWKLKQTWLQTVKPVLLFGFLSLLPTALLTLYLTAQDLGADYFYWAIKYPVYLQNVPLAKGWQFLVATLPMIIEGYWHWWILALIGLLAILIQAERKVKVLLGSFTLFTILSVTPRLTFHGHYFLFIFPVFALLAGIFFHIAEGFLVKKWSKKSASIMVLGVSVLLVAAHLFTNKSTYLKPNHESLIKELYGVNPFVEAKLIAEQIKARANEGDEMIVYGGEMQIYFYSGLKGPTRHLYGPYLVDGSPEQNQRQAAFMADAEKAKPRFFVAVNHPLTWVIRGNAANQKVFHWYGDFIENYRLIGQATMYQNKPSEYLWGKDLGNNELQGDYHIFVWERKAGAR